MPGPGVGTPVLGINQAQTYRVFWARSLVQNLLPPPPHPPRSWGKREGGCRRREARPCPGRPRAPPPTALPSLCVWADSQLAVPAPAGKTIPPRVPSQALFPACHGGHMSGFRGAALGEHRKAEPEAAGTRAAWPPEPGALCSGSARSAHNQGQGPLGLLESQFLHLSNEG